MPRTRRAHRRPRQGAVYRNATGAELTANAHRFVSRLAATRLLGYLRGQRECMSAHSSRPELVAAHGYDTKHRPARGGARRDHGRRGQAAGLRDSADVPPEPDRSWVDGWPHRSFPESWATTALTERAEPDLP